MNHMNTSAIKNLYTSINLKKAGVGQPKYCNNAYVHVVLTNLCSIISGHDLFWSNVEQGWIVHGFCSGLILKKWYFKWYLKILQKYIKNYFQISQVV